MILERYKGKTLHVRRRDGTTLRGEVSDVDEIGVLLSVESASVFIPYAAIEEVKEAIERSASQKSETSK